LYKESDEEDEAINRLRENSSIYRQLDTITEPTARIPTIPTNTSSTTATTTTATSTATVNGTAIIPLTISEDTPPDYKELFPLKSNVVTSSHQTDQPESELTINNQNRQSNTQNDIRTTFTDV
jgi:hypothetical protein